MVYQENKYNKVLQRSLCVAELQSIHLGERYCPWGFFFDWARPREARVLVTWPAFVPPILPYFTKVDKSEAYLPGSPLFSVEKEASPKAVLPRCNLTWPLATLSSLW